MKHIRLLPLLTSLTIISSFTHASEYPKPTDINIPPAPLNNIEKTAPAPTTVAPATINTTSSVAPTPAPTTTPPAATPTTTKNTHSDNMAGYLGIGIDLLPKAVAAQMPASVSAGQGIIVTRFAENSPAEKNGIKVNDILLTYDNTKIVHPQQFINLIRDDKPGRDVNMTLLRNGKIMTQKVTLGMQKVEPKGTIPANYTGLAIQKTGENTFDASIGVPMQDGSVKRRSFKGTREQIAQQVLRANDLPPAQRNQLLYALGGGSSNQNNGWGNWGNMNMFPFSNNNRNGFFPFGNNNGGNFNFPFGNNNGYGNRGFFPFGNNNGGNFNFPFGNNNGYGNRGFFPFNNNNNGGNFNFPFNNGNNRDSYFPNMFGSQR